MPISRASTLMPTDLMVSSAASIFSAPSVFSVSQASSTARRSDFDFTGQDCAMAGLLLASACASA